jgi:hypothetical protein
VRLIQVFTARNTGLKPLRLLDLRPECSCVVAQPSTWALAAGASSAIQVTFTVPDLEGPVSKGVEILTDAPGQETLRLVLKAQVVADLRLSANTVAFQAVPRNGGGLAEIRLENHSGESLRVPSIRTSAPEYLTVASVPQGQDLLLRLRLDGSRLPVARDQGLEWVEVRTTEPHPAQFRIQVQWTAIPSADPFPAP